MPAKSKGNYKELKHIVAEQDEDIKNGNASENAATTSGKPPPLYHKQSGIIGHDIAPTSRAVCFLCGEQIQKKTPRFEYVHEETGRKGVIMSAPRYIHDECVKYITLPSPKLNSIHYLKTRLSAPGEHLSDQLRAALQSLS